MATTTSATQLLLKNYTQYSMNPSSIMQDTLNVLEMLLGGQDIVDATNPFIFLLEASATATAAAIAASESIVRKLYPPLAMTQEDLYHHMSDLDYVGIFATGARSTINILMPYNILQNVAVYLDNSTEVKTVVIPRNSLISFNGIDLATCYPIQINLLAFNVVQVLYDTSIDNPLMPLTANVLEHAFVEYQNTQYLQIKVPVLQCTNISNIYAMSNVSSFTQVIPFSDNFYHARAFINFGDNIWKEILTTHTPMVYDISKPTLLLKVDGNSLNISLPDIYQSLNIAGISVRVDVYSTKGTLNIDLSQVAPVSFAVKWLDFDTLNPNAGVAPLSSINDMVIFSTEMLVGGSDAETIEGLREKVIYHVDATKAPVRVSDLNINLSNYGYTTQKLIDSVTDRVFVASKGLPMRNINGLRTMPLAANVNVAINMDDGQPGGLYRESIITQPVQRSTILPKALYLLENGNPRILSDAELTHIYGLTGQALCDYLNSGIYTYSPFHYVIDYAQPTITARPYYLTEPRINSRSFNAANITRNYNINTIGASISLVDNNYVLVLSASIPNGITGVSCQLTYFDVKSRTTLYINGVPDIMANTAMFTFTLQTNFDISQLDEIEILNFNNAVNVESAMFVNINSVFSIFYLVSGDRTGLETSFDNLYHVTSAMGPVIGATYESINVQFGTALKGLYCPARDLLTTIKYMTYSHVVYATYTDTVYQTGPLGKLYTINPDQTVTFLVLHQIGDPIHDSQGNPVILHNIGDLILDADGNPIPEPGSVNGVLKQIGITMVDAKYRFATGIATAAYTKMIPDNILGYLNQELAPSAGRLNERTELYYKPIGEPHTLNVHTGNGVVVQVPSILNVRITYYLTQDGITSGDVLAKISTLTRSILSDIIIQPTVSIAGLTTALAKANPAQVVGFNIDSFLPNDVPLVTLVDPGSSFIIGEELVVLPDGTLEVKDMVDIIFKSAL